MSDDHLSGNALAALLKLTCDMNGADYASYWVSFEDDRETEFHVVSSCYSTREHKADMVDKNGSEETFASKCEKFKHDDESVVAKVANTGLADFIGDAATNSKLDRGNLAEDYGINSICFLPVLGGVLEFGSSGQWENLPQAPQLNVAELKNAFNAFHSFYVLVWVRRGSYWFVLADYMIQEKQNALQNLGGKRPTFITKCRKMKLGADSVVNKAFENKIQLVVEDANHADEYERMKIADEFDVKTVRLIPGSDHVLEYGSSHEYMEPASDDEEDTENIDISDY